MATLPTVRISRFSSRFFVAMTAALLAMTVVICYLAGSHERNRVTREYASRMLSSVQFRAETLDQHIAHLKSDLHFLADLPAIQGTSRAIGNNGYDAQEQVTERFWAAQMRSVFHGYMSANSDLDQIIFASVLGTAKEIAGTGRAHGKVIDMAPGMLLTSFQLSCIRQAQALSSGHFFISEITSNHFADTTEASPSRQICAATPLFGATGRLTGVMLIVLNAQQLLAEQLRNTSNELQRYMLNAHGDYLLNPNPAHTFGFESGHDWRWQTEFHPLIGDLSKETGLQDYENDYGIVHVAASRVYLDDEDKTRYMTLIAALPESAIAHAVSAAQWLALLVTLGGGFSTGIIAFFFQRQQRKMRIHQARLGAIVESAHDAIISKSLDGTVTSWNKGAERLFGYTEQEAIGHKLIELIIPESCAQEEDAILTSIARGETLSRFETVRQHKDGSALMVSVSVAPLRDLRGQVVGASKTVHDISEQKATEAEILELNRKLEQQVAERTAEIREYAFLQRAILTAAGYAIIATNIDGIITLFNPAAEKMLGFAADEVVGKLSPVAFHDQGEIAARTQEFSEQLGINLERGMEVLIAKSRHDLDNEHEWTFVHKNGNRLPVWLSVSILRRDDGGVSGYLEMAVDISAQRAAEIAYKNNARFLGTLADNIPGMVGYWDKNLRCKFANRNYKEWFGRSPDAMIGMHLSDLLGPDLFKKNLPHIQASLRGEPQLFERVLTKADGSLAHTLCHYISDISDNQVRGFIVLITDVTEMKQVQLDIVDLNRRLESRTNEAEAASRAKSAFVANMSHEIRTPMNAVLGITDLLANSSLSPEQRKYTDMIRTAGESLMAILNDILDFSKIEANKLELEPKEFLLEDMLQVLGTIMAVGAGQKSLELTIAVGPDVPNGLIGDSLRLQQILTNLVGNAIKFTEYGEVKLSVKRVHEKQSIANKAATLCFEVKDTGIGISAEQIDKLFFAFSQADTSTTRRFGGSGLGLTISKSLVELMGGEIGVDSILGQGSRFWCTLPFDTFEVPQPHAKLPTVAPIRLLLADSNQSSLMHLQEIATSMGWDTDCVSSYADMISRQRNDLQIDRHYDAVLCDMHLLERNEEGNLPTLKADPRIATILITNGAGRTELESQIDVDKFDAVLVKPITASNLFNSINDVLRKKQGSPLIDEPGASKTSNKPLKGLRTLLVEDNHFNQIVGRGLLERAGAEVTLAGDGSEAVELLRTAHHDFDVVLMDIQMPVMDGFRATKIIREELKLSLPVLAMTAGVMHKERDRCINAGMDDFIAKPIDVEKMLAVLENYIPHTQNRTVEVIHNLNPAAQVPDEDATDEMELRNKKILDIDALLIDNQDSEDLRASISQIIEGVASQGLQMEAEIREAWQANDIQGTMRLLHKSRGGIGSLGAERWTALTTNIEKLLQEGRTKDATPLIPELRKEMELIIGAAHAWLHKQESLTRDAGFSGELFEQFRRALLQSNMNALDLFGKLRIALAQHMSAADMEQLNLHMRNLEFDKASDLVTHLHSSSEP